ncbi:Zinc finger CCCH domain-containing protein 1 [Ananas comosus]|uniref:Zinc finger CCCH domain-containing protein 1 n=1 Tax=Ananas comosus TaxID=4615 RepID=A0A199UEW9_ANACO|nr:Zinc finger CCCH domain-containing protein 1 [Ananas comosus]
MGGSKMFIMNNSMAILLLTIALVLDLPFACSICCLPFQDLVVTKCKHYFCGNCVLMVSIWNPLNMAREVRDDPFFVQFLFSTESAYTYSRRVDFACRRRHAVQIILNVKKRDLQALKKSKTLPSLSPSNFPMDIFSRPAVDLGMLDPYGCYLAINYLDRTIYIVGNINHVDDEVHVVASCISLAAKMTHSDYSVANLSVSIDRVLVHFTRAS